MLKISSATENPGRDPTQTIHHFSEKPKKPDAVLQTPTTDAKEEASPENEKRITVMGMVKRPGKIPFPLNGRLKLLSAIAMAGGWVDATAPRNVGLTRNGKKFNIDVKKMNQGDLAPIYLQPNDLVTVDGPFVMVLGEVHSPGKVTIPLKTSLDLQSAIAIAGGLTPEANPQNVILRRKGKELMIKYNDLVKPDAAPVLLEHRDLIRIEK